MDISHILQEEFSLKQWQVKNVIDLIDQGNTIPFIARYRKEKTGSLSDAVLRDFYERLTYLRNLETKKEQVIRSIEEQGKLTLELKEKIEKSNTVTEVEDLYRPYRPKRRTKATIAKEKGLEPLASKLWSQNDEFDINSEAKKYISEAKEVLTEQNALQGARDIISEWISDEAEYRTYIRKYTWNNGKLVTKAKDDKLESVYEMYYDYDEPIKQLPGHRILAINRGEKEKILSVKIEILVDEVESYLQRKLIKTKYTPVLEQIDKSIQDAYKRLIAPAIEREIRNELTEKAEMGALYVFKKNLHQLLMQPPIRDHVTMGVDPAYRTGCKIAVVDGTGKVLDTTVVYPTPPENQVQKAKEVLSKMIKQYDVQLLSIGNGTASRETEQFAADMIKEIGGDLQYVIVNEAGASVYSASKLATEEFPEFDVGQRSAASIARRLQDPLAELVKIDPKSIGVGQYQHDMNQKRLEEVLSGVVESAVNSVGADLNTASVSLLEYVAGIRKTVAKNIVKYREENGKFTTRKELLKVKQLGPKVFEQCAGFLRITDAKNPLDRTGVHPESYEVAQRVLNEIQIGQKMQNIEEVAKELQVGIPTLQDIIKELEKPGRDPREDMPKPILRSDVLEMEDLKSGMVLKGTVRNITDFGAFVDIGVHQDGLVHISQMADRYIKHPLEVVSVGDIVNVRVMDVEINKHRIALSMKEG